MKKLIALFDEPREIAAWLVMALAVGGLYVEKLDQWPAVALVCVSLVTLLGVSTYRGIHIGPDGVDVNGGKSDE